MSKLLAPESPEKNEIEKVKETLSAKEFGKEVLRVREKLGLSQRKLAAIIKVDPSVISRVENGNHIITLELVYLLANGLGENPHRLADIYWGLQNEYRGEDAIVILADFARTINEFFSSSNPTPTPRPGAISPMPVYRLEDVNENDLANQKRSDTLALEEFKKRGLGKDKDKDNTPSKVESEKPPEQI